MDGMKIRELFSARERNRCEVYHKIYLKCVHHIELHVQRNNEYCIFKIPAYIFGFPRFSLEDCAEYIRKELVMKGFDVHVRWEMSKGIQSLSSSTLPVLDISWKKWKPTKEEVHEQVRLENSIDEHRQSNRSIVSYPTMTRKIVIPKTPAKKRNALLPPPPTLHASHHHTSHHVQQPIMIPPSSRYTIPKSLHTSTPLPKSIQPHHSGHDSGHEKNKMHHQYLPIENTNTNTNTNTNIKNIKRKVYKKPVKQKNKKEGNTLRLDLDSDWD